jgi:hypothetical protein
MMGNFKTAEGSMATLKGKASTVVHDVGTYQHLLDVKARADATEGIRQGLKDAREGKTRPAREFFDQFESENRLPRAYRK